MVVKYSLYNVLKTFCCIGLLYLITPQHRIHKVVFEWTCFLYLATESVCGQPQPIIAVPTDNNDRCIQYVIYWYYGINLNEKYNYSFLIIVVLILDMSHMHWCTFWVICFNFLIISEYLLCILVREAKYTIHFV